MLFPGNLRGAGEKEARGKGQQRALKKELLVELHLCFGVYR